MTGRVQQELKKMRDEMDGLQGDFTDKLASRHGFYSKNNRNRTVLQPCCTTTVLYRNRTVSQPYRIATVPYRNSTVRSRHGTIRLPYGYATDTDPLRTHTHGTLRYGHKVNILTELIRAEF